MREDHIADHITTSSFPPRLPRSHFIHLFPSLAHWYLSLEVVIGREYSVSAIRHPQKQGHHPSARQRQRHAPPTEHPATLGALPCQVWQADLVWLLVDGIAAAREAEDKGATDTGMVAPPPSSSPRKEKGVVLKALISTGIVPPSKHPVLRGSTQGEGRASSFRVGAATDYFSSILGLVRQGSTWSLNPKPTAAGASVR
jgi:hypothetical protein